MKRKFFAAFLSLCMVMSLVPMTALAADNEENTITSETRTLTEGTYSLNSDVTLTAPITISAGANVIINGKGHTISFAGSDSMKVAFTGSDTNQVEGIPAGVSLTIDDVNFKNTNGETTPQGYAVLIGGNSYGTTVSLSGCTFTNLYTAVYANQYTGGEEQQTPPSIKISGCTYKNTTFGYSMDEVTVGALVGDKGTSVTFNQNNTGVTNEKEVFKNVVYLNDKSYGNGSDALTTALNEAQNGDTIRLAPGEYTAPGNASNGRYAGPVVNLIGAGSDETTIKGGLWMGGTGNDSVSVSGPIEVSGISFDCPENYWSNSGLGFSHIGKCEITVKNCEFSGFQHGVHMNTSQAELTVADTAFSNVIIAMSAQSDSGTLHVGENVDTSGATFAVQAFGGTGQEAKDYHYTTTDAYEKAMEAAGEGASGMDRFDNSQLGEDDVVSGTVQTVTNSEGLTNALANAQDGTVIVLASGTYDGPFTINNSVTLMGPNVGVSGTGTRSDEAVMTGKITVNGSRDASKKTTVVLDGLKFTGSGIINTGASADMHGVNLTVQNCVAEDVTGGTFVTTSGPTGLSPEKGLHGTITIVNNKVSGVTATNASAFNLWYANEHVITGNVVENVAFNAFNLNQTVGDVTFENNAISDVEEYGLQLANSISGENSEINIRDNSFSDVKSGKAAINISGTVSAGTVTIENNEVFSDENGVAIQMKEATVDNTVDLTITNNTFNNAPVGATVGENSNMATVTVKNGTAVLEVTTITSGRTYTLPAALPNQGYNHFVGWNDGTTTYDANTPVKIEKDTTFTAQWSYVPPANPNYKITIGAMENGTVTANPTAAKAGATVTLTPVPDEGYALSTLTVTDRFGDAVRVTENSDGTYTFPMPNGQVTVTATFVETEAPVAEPFVDVAEGDWFYDAVVYAYQNELMDGVGGNRFAPNSETTRAQLVTILYRLEGEPTVSGDLPFTDVEAGIWYTDAILWAAQNGIVNGVTDTTFAPGDEITRQQLVTILYRYAEAKGYDVSASADLSGYPDAGQVQAYAQPAMAWAVAENIIQGMEDGTLKPAGNASRAQIATILMRFCEDVAQ